VDADISYWGYSREELAVYEKHNITRAEYDDNSAVIDGKPVYLNGKAELRIRYLTPYNFIIAPHNSPINNSSYDKRRNEMMNGILNGKMKLEELVDEVLRLPKRGY
ncbi:SEFIR domain-containing protein, partial [Nitrosococcus oceani C-27]